MSNILAALLLLSSTQAAPPPPPPSTPVPFCKRIPTKGLRLGTVGGDYVIVGKLPITEHFYQGRVKLIDHGGHLTFSGLINGKKASGQAWAIECGPDRVRQIEIKHAGRPNSRHCSIGQDYENYLRFTCGPNGASDHKSTGLETWFGLYEPPDAL